MREALNLVDFFVENYVDEADRQDLDALAEAASGSSGLEGGLKHIPVTAVGVVGEGDLVGLFKHYLITRLSERDPELRARYVQNEAVFGALLGLTGTEQLKVKESLGFTAYKNMVKTVLMYKGVSCVLCRVSVCVYVCVCVCLCVLCCVL